VLRGSSSFSSWFLRKFERWWLQTLGEVKQFAAEQLGEDYSDPTLSTVLIPRWVTRGMEKIFRRTWWRWNEDKISLSWPQAGVEGSVLYLPHFIFRIISLPPASSSSASPVEMVSAAELDYSLGRTRRARPQLVLHGYYGVEADNPSEGTLTVACVGGTGNQSVRIHGLTPANYEITETVVVAAAGSTPSVNSFKAGVGGVRNIELSGAANGGVVTVSRGGTTLERLDSTRERRHEHLRTEMSRVGGGSSATFLVRFWRRPAPLVNDDDIVPIPYEFHSLLETWIEAEILRWREQFEPWVLLRKEFEMELMEAIRHDRRDPARRRRFNVAWGRGVMR
jgi:hypothetical protein